MQWNLAAFFLLGPISIWAVAVAVCRVSYRVDPDRSVVIGVAATACISAVASGTMAAFASSVSHYRVEQLDLFVIAKAVLMYATIGVVLGFFVSLPPTWIYAIWNSARALVRDQAAQCCLEQDAREPQNAAATAAPSRDFEDRS
jgi:hypothetical protein